LAEKFLLKNGFGVVFNDKFKAVTKSGEQPDCIGFRSGVSCLIECKTSRSDFLADRKKRFRVDPNLGMGDWRFMLVPKGLITTEELPDGWGLLETDGRRVYKKHGWPSNMDWIDGVTGKPYTACKWSEQSMMYSALRRMHIRGHLKEIYHGLPGDTK
jgi:hypothetical protein